MRDRQGDLAVLTFPGNEVAGAALAMHWGAPAWPIKLHRFPDGETSVIVPTELEGRSVVLVCTLDRPDEKLAALLFAADAAREMGAAQVGLVAPYLAYMRQDKRFEPGQAISVRTFANVLSQRLDFLLTVDPHLHRIHDLGEVYDMPSQVVGAGPAIADWLRSQLDRPLLVGPDGESRQWTAAVADRLGAPYLVLDKIRRGDQDVEVSVPDCRDYAGHTPVLLDDILSTGRTMIAALARLRATGLAAPWCVAVHPILAGSAYAELQAAGPARIVSCNTIAHETNAIDVMPLLAEALWSAIPELP